MKKALKKISALLLAVTLINTGGFLTSQYSDINGNSYVIEASAADWHYCGCYSRFDCNGSVYTGTIYVYSNEIENGVQLKIYKGGHLVRFATLTGNFYTSGTLK